jgi:hypothetical protein
MEKKFYSLRENWELLKPFLEDKEVLDTLDEAMKDYCEQHMRKDRMWRGKNEAPWEYTSTAIWDEEINDRVTEDDDFQVEVADINDDDYFFEVYDKYYAKHEPKKGEMEYYQLFHGAHWISHFVAALLSQSLKVYAFVLSSEKYSVACFIMDDILYYADILETFKSVDELDRFMDDVEIYH